MYFFFRVCVCTFFLEFELEFAYVLFHFFFRVCVCTVFTFFLELYGFHFFFRVCVSSITHTVFTFF